MADYAATEINVPFDAMRPTPIRPDPPTEYRLPDEQAALVKGAQEKSMRAKLKLADTEIDYLNRKNELINDINESWALIQRVIQDVAQASGMSAQGGTWDFDLATMTYKRRP
jgi:hypothetical protein